MYSSTTLREVTVVDGAQLIIASPPARSHRNADGSAHMWRPAAAASCSACTFIFEAVVTRRGSRCSLHKSGLRRVRGEVQTCTSTRPRTLQVAARSGNRSDGRSPPDLFRENTNLEWMVLPSRKLTPPVDSIFRAGLRVRSERAASAQRAATTPRRSPPPRCRRLSRCASITVDQEMASPTLPLLHICVTEARGQRALGQ
ncbi:hypothetical protein PYW08_000940 [Mythimna loreyi]|uniref:Uncharacterized protein n=1 Tax=Mythimna loreyi TaxID=667449 RepID=A0ACC2R063_9NEOP|nr:hypothetical protein PYW08_000940 [Mythimna loreyi]